MSPKDTAMPEAAQTDLFARPTRDASRIAATEAPAAAIATSQLIFDRQPTRAGGRKR